MSEPDFLRYRIYSTNVSVSAQDTVWYTDEEVIVTGTQDQPRGLATATYDVQRIPNYEQILSSVLVLHVLSNGSRERRALPDWLGSCCNLKQLILVDIEIDEFNAKPLTSLITLVLHKCYVQDVPAFVRGLAVIPTLKRVYVGSTYYGTKEFDQLKRVLEEGL